MLAALVLMGALAVDQKQVLDELTSFLSIPNQASDTANIERNAQALVAMFAKRGVTARLLRVDGAPPLVVADVPAAKAAPTVAFYAHYDGQPVDEARWTSPPCRRARRGPAGGAADERRLYARSAGDDKAPIVAMLAALDVLRARKQQPAVNLRFVFEGEEEAGSAHLPAYLDRFAADLAADAWLLCDGPVHQSRRMQLYFGARGVTDLEITTWGPLRPLHSGHYGNWAPNPIVTLTDLIASMRDTEGRILIPGFYEDVAPLTPAERKAVADVPSVDAELARSFALGRTEGAPHGLVDQILLPAINVRGIAGGNVGALASNAIPSEARASIDFRLVPRQTPEGVRERVERFIAAGGFTIGRATPVAAARAAHPKIVKLEWGSGGYPPARTSMDSPFARGVIDAVTRASGEAPVLMPTLGGSIPMYLFARGTPVIGLPIVNHDNNQHAADENLRLQNLWDGIEVFVELFTTPLTR